jgi:hypothetical protein
VQTTKQIILNSTVLAALVVTLELHETGVKIKWKINLWSAIKRDITCSYEKVGIVTPCFDCL